MTGIKDIKGNPISGGSRVKIMVGPGKGKSGYVYNYNGNNIRVTSKPQTGLLGWYKGNQLLVTRK